ncbi:MAG: carboxypeptidase-like regulatory domain-containing protein [Flavobacteriales bacterium]|nr:carboxypeptidase-like regulatory domain-containing protein [Flavobacteriales bacterium]
MLYLFTNRKYALALLLVTWFAGVLSSQAQTEVSGHVYDAATGEVLPFVNVSYKNGRVGTTTNEDGYYFLSTNFPTDSLLVSFVGYKSQVHPVKKNQKQTLDIRLESSQIDLEEMVIYAPTENPAHLLHRNIVSHKKLNNKDKLDAYQYEVYTKIEFDLNNFNEKFKDRRMFKPFRFVFDNVDTAENGKPYLPMVMSESISDFYYKNKPHAQKEFIKASRVSGIDNQSVSQFTGDMYQDFNIYDNFMVIFGKNFVSPIADNALSYYKLFLMDSATIDGKWCYKVVFEPKRKQELVMVGHYWVTDTTYAITSIDMEIAPGANLNYVDEMFIKQEFREVTDSVWMLTREELLVDFNLTEKSMGFFGRKTSMYDQFVINKPKDNAFYTADNIIVAEDANAKDEAYWETARHEPLTKTEATIYATVDSVQSLPAFRTYVDIITMFVTGYEKWGLFELGPYFTTYSFNALEGNRLRFGGRTSNKFSKKLELNGYVAYGFKDEVFKYGGGFRYLFTKHPRQMLEGSFKYDMEQLGQSQNAFREDNILASVLRRAPFDQLIMTREAKGYYDIEWFPGFRNRIGMMHKRFIPQANLGYKYIDDDGQLRIKEEIAVSEIQFYTRFAHNEKYVSGEMDRISLGTKYPVIQFQYTLGIKDLWSSDYGYHRVNLNMRHYFYIGPYGYTSYILDAGKIWGKLPYSLLELHQGNETYTSDEYAFNMMNYIEFVSDQYASLTFTHHFEGYFLNRIPLFRKLKWREVISGKTVYGTLQSSNKDVVIFPEGLSDLGTPYMEGSIGIENIFKIIRIDLYRRLTHLDNPGAPKLGIRGNITVMF